MPVVLLAISVTAAVLLLVGGLIGRATAPDDAPRVVTVVPPAPATIPTPIVMCVGGIPIFNLGCRHVVVPPAALPTMPSLPIATPATSDPFAWLGIATATPIYGYPFTTPTATPTPHWAYTPVPVATPSAVPVPSMRPVQPSQQQWIQQNANPSQTVNVYPQGGTSTGSGTCVLLCGIDFGSADHVKVELKFELDRNPPPTATTQPLPMEPTVEPTPEPTLEPTATPTVTATPLGMRGIGGLSTPTPTPDPLSNPCPKGGPNELEIAMAARLGISFC